ncbi:peptidoglycan-binding domain-containing protein [Thioclava dalianensis]|uniref:peptidoglycan-binding domain-containing protein n=1 Tax=Thioclava dalianensis TaxID=1185766 RepID=UPI00068CAF32|nr:peptidoglycan-binding domain-containing protein [Thioclava dalianensis]
MHPGCAAAGPLLALALLAGCQTGGTDLQRPPPGPTLASEVSTQRPATDAKGCYAELKAPAQVETVTHQVQVIPEQRDAKTGAITQPAIYREMSAQRMIDAGKPRYFRAMCTADLTPSFVAMLQRALAARNLYHGRADGTLDPATGTAIRAYQAPRGLDSATLSLRAAQEMGLYIYTP